MASRGMRILRAIQSRPWPASSANLEYAAVWGTRAPVSESVDRVCDDAHVRAISTLLEPGGRAPGVAVRLRENMQLAFGGMKPYGDGFMVTAADVSAWIDDDNRSREVLWPYLNGEEVNSSPSMQPTRWVIDFNDLSIPRATTYAGPFTRLESTAKEDRQRSKRKSLRERWWQFADKRPALRAAIASLDEVLVLTNVSKTVMPAIVSARIRYSHALTVFASEDRALLAVLSSSLHQLWAITYGSGMRNDPRYTPSDVFETLPRPASTDWLDRVGRALEEERTEIMLRRDLGLTNLYNLVNDPGISDTADGDVARMRAIHVELDQAVMDAYGWSDISLDHGFHTYRQMERWTVSPVARVQILDRLLEENHRRGDAESTNVPATGKGRKKAPAQSQEGLFS